MKKISAFIICFSIILTGCNRGGNSLETMQLSDSETRLASALSETLFAYELEHHDLDKPYFNVWVEEYVNGEKQGADTMIYSSERTETGGNEKVYLSFQATGVNEQEKLIRIIHANAGGHSVSQDVISFDDKVNNSGRTSSNEMGNPDFGNDEEVIIGVIQYTGVLSDIEGITPEVLNDSNTSIEDTLKDNSVSYLVKAQFSSEQRSK